MPRRGENIRKRKDGRWEARYIKSYTSDGKAVYGSVYGKTYYEVKQKQNEAIEYLSYKSLPLKTHEITFKEVLFLWLNNNRLNLKDQTYAKYQYLIEKHIIPSLGNAKIKNIESSTINEFLYNKKEYGRLNGNGGLSASYIQTVYFIINSTIDYSIKMGYRNRLAGEIVKPYKKAYKTSPEILSRNEQNILENYLLKEMNEKSLGILLSLHIGLRIGEVCGLKWEDIDFSDNTIHILHTVERITNVNSLPHDSKTTLKLCDTKSISSRRIIPIPNKMLFILSKYKSRNGFVLKGKSYEYTDPRTLQNYFHKCLDKCNLRNINFHALRHSFATRCIEAGMDVKTLSEILGHSNVNITLNTYVHTTLEHKKKQIELLDFIGGK